MNQDTAAPAAVPDGVAPPPQGRDEHPEGTPADLQRAEAGLAVLLEASQRAIEELGAMLPPAQVRALLVIDTEDDLNVTGLARVLQTISPAGREDLARGLSELLTPPDPSRRGGPGAVSSR